MDTSRPVSEIMTRHLFVVTSETSIDHIHDLFASHNFHHLPVVDHGKLTGIVSKSDYLKICHVLSTTWNGKTHVQELHKGMTAAQIMTHNPLKIEPQDTIGLAAVIFLSNSLHALPVVEGGRLVGIITSHDLLDYAYRQLIES